jgi:hypothetical protein
MRNAQCTRNSSIMTKISNGTYVQNARFKDYGSLPEDIPSWDMRARRHAQVLKQLQTDKAKAR